MVCHIVYLPRLPAENPFFFCGEIIVKVIPFVVKGLEIVRFLDPVPDDKAQHHPPGLLGIGGDIPETYSLRFFKDRGNYFVGKALRLNGIEIFPGGQIDQHGTALLAGALLARINSYSIRDDVFPELIQIPAFGILHFGTHLQPVGEDQVQGLQNTIESREYADMVLGK